MCLSFEGKQFVPEILIRLLPRSLNEPRESTPTWLFQVWGLMLEKEEMDRFKNHSLKQRTGIRNNNKGFPIVDD